jgi:integrase/recombinase XerD
MANLKDQNISKGFDENTWIIIKRAKTSKELMVPLFPEAEKIIEKYKHTTTSDKIFPSISNQKFNSYLKDIAILAKIDKRVTHHTARKTFASTVLLYNDVPMEIVSELLGHSSMKITQDYYGKIIRKKVSQEYNKLQQRMNPRASSSETSEAVKEE